MYHGVSPKIPVFFTENEPLNQTIQESTAQNLRTLLLTSPGERVMDVEFGVGLRKYLFEPNLYGTQSAIEGEIKAQAQKYMPFISIIDISFARGSLAGGTLQRHEDPETWAPEKLFDSHVMAGSGQLAGSAEDNALTIKIKYMIVPLAHIDIFVINSDLMI